MDGTRLGGAVWGGGGVRMRASSLEGDSVGWRGVRCRGVRTLPTYLMGGGWKGKGGRMRERVPY